MAIGVNKVFLMGNLTRDVECRVIGPDGKIAKFGFCVNNARKKGETEPCFIDVEAWNRGTYKMADLCEQYLRKGSKCFIEGKLKFEQWTSQDGQKRSKLKVEADSVQFLDSKPQSSDMGPVDNGPDAPF